jgi:hypothetical protein
MGWFLSGAMNTHALFASINWQTGELKLDPQSINQPLSQLARWLEWMCYAPRNHLQQ